MTMSRGVSSSFALVLNTKPLVGALAAALLLCPPAYAASFGHSRIVSNLGQPLGIDIPVSQLSADELRTLVVTPAPMSAWQQAGLTPPVDLADLQVHVIDGYTAGAKVIQLRSSQAFDRPVADVLLDVRTSTGQQRYQVSLLAQGGTVPGAAQRSSELRAGSNTGAPKAGYTIKVRRGDTMFAIAQRNAVQGASVYQVMIALQRANPRAFIHGNINLVKAGANLTMPGVADITSISDREARRIFMQQVREFALYRQRVAAGATPVGTQGDAAAGQVSAAGAEPQAVVPGQPQDQLRLSRGSASPDAAAGGASAAGADGSSADARSDDALATRKGIEESEQRVSQLEQNVKNLSEALQAQGGAASGLIVDGAKGLGQTLADAVGASDASEGTAQSGNGAAAGSGKAGGATQNANVAGGNSGAAAIAGANAGGNPSAHTQRPDSGAANGQHSAGGGSSGNGSAPANASHAGSTGGNATGGSATSGTSTNGNSTTGTPAPGSSATAQAGAAAAANGAGSANGTTAANGTDSANGTTAANAAGSANGTNATNGAATANGAAATNSAVPPNGTAAASGSSPAASSSAQGGAADSGSAGQASGAAVPTPDRPSGGSDKAGGANSAGVAPSIPGSAPSAAGANGGTSRADTAPGTASDKQVDGASNNDSHSTKAEQSVSWLQEHMLGVITGVLAFIVLVIAWLLRRANSANRDGADGQGVITDAMVQEKLEQINLNLDDGAETPRHRRS